LFVAQPSADIVIKSPPNIVQSFISLAPLILLFGPSEPRHVKGERIANNGVGGGLWGGLRLKHRFQWVVPKGAPLRSRPVSSQCTS
jgi:hypothetical protein